MKIGLAACALAAACFFAAPAWSGVSPPPSQAAPAALARVPSGEIESGQVASAEAARLLRIAPRGLTPLRQELPRVGRALDRMGRRDQRQCPSAAGRGRLLGQPKRARLVSRRQLLRKRHVRSSVTARSRRAPPSSSPSPAASGSPRPRSPASGPTPWYKARPGDPAYALFQGADPRPHQVARPDQETQPEAQRRISRGPAGSLFFRGPPSSRPGCPTTTSSMRLGFCPREDIPAILTRPDVAWGFHVFLQPLPPGKYTAPLQGRCRPHRLQPGAMPIRQDVTYHLTVRPDLN